VAALGQLRPVEHSHAGDRTGVTTVEEIVGTMKRLYGQSQSTKQPWIAAAGTMICAKVEERTHLPRSRAGSYILGRFSDLLHATTRSRPFDSIFSTSAAGRGGLKR